jgi:WD40 repeat protein
LGSETIPHYCECPISVSTDNKYFATGSTKGEVYIFKLEDGSLEQTLDNKSKAITALKWRPFNSQIYVGDFSGVLSIWGV